VLKELVNHGGQLTPALLSTAAVNNSYDIARYLVKNGVSIASDDYDALVTALSHEHMETVYAMLEETDEAIPDDIIEELLELAGDNPEFRNYIRQFSENYTE
jgi:ankyrin repeat protein